ncbi:MAG: hypothetical protein GC152_10300 [Alphaproteobacteria bacterium]|nr:hypothetical protein [Alphaproteobacteria bacterium]
MFAFTILLANFRRRGARRTILRTGVASVGVLLGASFGAWIGSIAYAGGDPLDDELSGGIPMQRLLTEWDRAPPRRSPAIRGPGSAQRPPATPVNALAPVQGPAHDDPQTDVVQRIVCVLNAEGQFELVKVSASVDEAWFDAAAIDAVIGLDANPSCTDKDRLIADLVDEAPDGPVDEELAFLIDNRHSPGVLVGGWGGGPVARSPRAGLIGGGEAAGGPTGGSSGGSIGGPTGRSGGFPGASGGEQDSGPDNGSGNGQDNNSANNDDPGPQAPDPDNEAEPGDSLSDQVSDLVAGDVMDDDPAADDEEGIDDQNGNPPIALVDNGPEDGAAVLETPLPPSFWIMFLSLGCFAATARRPADGPSRRLIGDPS